MSFRTEGMLSNGVSAWGIENGLLTPLSASMDRPYFEGFVAMSATLFSILDLGVGYSYSGRGLEVAAWKTAHDSMSAYGASGGIQDAVVLGYRAISEGADAFLRHRVCISLAIPRITDRAGATLFAFVSPQDASARLLLDLFAEGADISSLHIRFELYPSSLGTAYGSSPFLASLSLIADFSARERL
jgi:hypothetical protein